VACFGSVISPPLIMLTRCGPDGMTTCLGNHVASGYGTLLGFSATAQPVKTIVAGMIVVGSGVALHRLWRALRPGREPWTVSDRSESGPTTTIMVGAATICAAVLLAGASLAL
jgi:hypothetical protein